MIFVSHRVLYKIAVEMNSSLDPNKVLNAIVKTITEAMGAKGSALMLLSLDGKELIHTVDYGLGDWYTKKESDRVDAVTAEVLQGKPIWIPDMENDSRIQYPEEAKKEGITSVLSLPFRLKSEVIGVLMIYLLNPRTLSYEAIEFLDAAASLGAIALEKARLYESQGRDLKNMIAHMEKLAEEKSRFMHFFGIAAHDLKAPLEAIQSYLWVILGGYAGELNPKHRTMIERSSKRMDNLLDLISDLLDVNRVGVGKIFDEREDVSLNKVVEICLDMAQDLARSKDIELVIDMPKKLPIIRSSSLRLQQVLSNLLSNAIKYSNKRTKVIFRINVTKTQIEVEVIDEGIGIPKKDLPNLFEEFFRATNVGERTGTGLGLYIVKRIIDAHKGKIWVESPCAETGKGSKFAFIIPYTIRYNNYNNACDKE
jgi:signal transduction histidine kinase